MSGTRWDDLAVRLASAAGLIAVGLGGVWLGGLPFHLLVAAVCGLMLWELVGLLDSRPARSAPMLGLLAFACVLAAVELPVLTGVSPAVALPFLMLPSLAGLGRMQKGGVTYAVFAALILLAGYGLIGLRDQMGLIWMLWLVLVVVATDVLGYFAGRALGGPKLWSRVSPSKTWSGAVAGWLGAAALGLAFAQATGAGWGLAAVSVALSMASQIGDIAESAVKRRVGVKDSSHLIPGHGGLMDRFDGMLGAAVFLVVAAPMTGFPPGMGG